MHVYFQAVSDLSDDQGVDSDMEDNIDDDFDSKSFIFTIL